MAIIRQLPSDVINKIAAGEVVERPSSVVKELVENSLDAGATRVDVELEGGGRDLIRIADDGKGMSREDALLCTERHATSKLVDAEGLFHIASFGFRGEAIPAIASVSRMTLTTREPDSLEGTRIVIEGGRAIAVESCGAPRGTTLEIRDLFYATPARRKFLKRPETESGHVSETVVRLALARPDVSFSLRSGDRTSFRSPAGPDPRERIAAAIGKEIFPHLLAVEHTRGATRVHGFVASPVFSLPTPRATYLFVNGRFVRDRPLQHAMQRAYDGLLPSGRSPGLVLFVEVPPHEVDVNVHPQKMEVRFADPRGVYDAVARAIGDSLGKGDWLRATVGGAGSPGRSYAVAPSTQPNFAWNARGPGSRDGIREAAAALWPREGDRDAAGVVNASPGVCATSTGIDPALATHDLPSAVPMSGVSPGGAIVLDGEADRGGAIGWSGGVGPGEAIGGPDENGVVASGPGTGHGAAAEGLRFVGVLSSGYLVCERADGGLVIVDPARLREGIEHSRLRSFAEGRERGQPFLFPVIVDPGMPLARDLLTRIEDVRALGFEIEPFGGTAFALQSVPPPLVGADYQRLLTEVTAALGADGDGRRSALARMASFAATVSQPALLPEEAAALLDEVHARQVTTAVVAALPLTELHRRAGRS